MYLLRVVTVDFYMSPPIQGLDVMYSEFRGMPNHQVPVIRIFGPTDSGVKTCLHVHGVFPYIYIPFDNQGSANKLMYQIAASLDKAINVSFGKASSNAHHVYKVALVNGIPLYGYHKREHTFLKIYFYNPLIVKKACTLLQNRTILGKVFQPYEAHIPYILQFMIDYNIHGMSYVSLSEVLYRRESKIEIPPELFLPANISKITYSSVEIDGTAENIVNRLEIQGGRLAVNPGIAALWEDEKQRHRNQDKESQLSHCLTQNRTDFPPTGTHVFFKKMLQERLTSSRVFRNVKRKANASIYPAESSSDVTLNASFLDLPFSQASSTESEENLMDDTMVKDLVNVLTDLNKANEDEAVEEEDSILSQAPNKEPEDDFDMSLPLEIFSTPGKELICDNKNEESEDLDDIFNTTFIPQVDGADDIIERGTRRIYSEDTRQKMKLVTNRINSRKKKGARGILQNGYQLGRRKIRENVANSPLKSSQYAENQSVNELLSRMQSNCLDGTNDSSSDEDICESTFIETNTIATKSKLKSSKKYFTPSQGSPSSYKRKLNFAETHFSDTTLMEEKIACAYKSEERTPIICSQNRYQIALNISVDNSMDTLPQNVEERENDRNLKAQEVCEKYDMNRSFFPAAGTSKLTPIPTDNCSDCDETLIDYSPDLSLSDTITSYQREIHEQIGDISLNSQGLRTWIPKFDPPDRDIIKRTMKDYNIPEVRHLKPFYSNYSDVTTGIEIGANTLIKIESTTTKDLPPFKAQNEDYGLLYARSLKLQQLGIEQDVNKFSKLHYVKSTTCYVTPVKLPPTRKEVQLWLETKSNELAAKPTKKKKIKMRIPVSPNADAGSDEDDSMSISSCSPENSINLELSQGSNSSSNMTSPVLNRKGKKMGKRKTKQFEGDESKELRKTLLQSQFIHQMCKEQEKNRSSYEVTGATLDLSQSFKASLENLKRAKAVIDHQYLTVLVLELHVQTRADFNPDPAFDSILSAFYTVTNDVPENSPKASKYSGLIAVGESKETLLLAAGINCNILCVKSELDLINAVVKLVREWDPDIVAGYEIEMLSWGYLIERGFVLGVNLLQLLSRTSISLTRTENEDVTDLKLPGRIILNVWRLMRHEIALQSYTLENVMYHVLHQRIPQFSFKNLSFWWDQPSGLHCYVTAKYYLQRVEGVLELLNQLDIIGRTSELARLFGIQFFEVLSRGSQFRVESMMLRLAKPLNFIPVSPSIGQRAQMKAPEALPLILEPESKFYSDPMIVLDFQSLYPSIIIAYNYCFSTCLGRVQHLGQNGIFEFGATELKVPRRTVKGLLKEDKLTFSPSGIVFAKPEIRQGILPQMLQEILDTRLMVKKSMKENKEDKLLQRVLHNRQLGLKLIANVTFGYTSANFSGRMPSVEIGDSILSKARETLLRAIKLIENTAKWAAKVVYGDTDSIFVLVAGRSKEEAFKIGAEIADAVTNDNPSPVKLKLEKIFFPCILQTKKRYVGYMFESVEQEEPEFLAKGIETVRRDGCPAVSKMLEKSLKILFDKRDVSQVREYVVRQFKKIFSGRVSIQDLTFAKEYRGASSYRPGACVPALELARKWKSVDRRSEPRKGERVPYVIIHGHPGLPLIKLVRSPRDLLADCNLQPNALYYVTKMIIPALNRCFLLIGADLNIWFNNMPRKQIQYLPNITPSSSSKKFTIPQYFPTTNCVQCGLQGTEGICEKCRGKPHVTYVALQTKLNHWERTYSNINLICQTCCATWRDVRCISLDCPILYRRVQSCRDLEQGPYLRDLLHTTFDL